MVRLMNNDHADVHERVHDHDGAHDDDVASGYQDGWDDKEGHRYDGHVDLPLPLLAERDPALSAVVGDLIRVVKVQDRR